MADSPALASKEISVHSAYIGGTQLVVSCEYERVEALREQEQERLLTGFKHNTNMPLVRRREWSRCSLLAIGDGRKS